MADEDKAPAKSMHFEEQADPTKVDLGDWENLDSPNSQEFRRPTVDFTAVQFTGDNFEEVQAFVGTREIPTDEAFDIDANRPYVIPNFNRLGTYLIPTEKNMGNQGELWDAEAKIWRPVKAGDWIVQQDEGWLTVTTEWLEINCFRLDQETRALIREMERPKSFYESLTALLNHHSKENDSGTPDWILSQYLLSSLRNFENAVKMRAEWRGESVELPALQRLRDGRDKMDQMIAFLRSKVEEGVIQITEPLEATDIYRQLQDYQPPEPLDAIAGSQTMIDLGDHLQAGFEAGLTQGPDEVYAPGALDGNDGKEVPLVIYTNGQRNEIGTAKLHVTPGEMAVTAQITGALPVFGAENISAAYSLELDEPKDEPAKEDPMRGEALDAFRRYQQKGLTDNDK